MSEQQVKKPRHVFTAVITAAAGASAELDLVRAPPGKRLRLKKTLVHFPSGTGNMLQVQIRYGSMAVIPDEGYIQGDDSRYEFDKEWVYESGSCVKVFYKNLDAVNAKTFDIAITMEEE